MSANKMRPGGARQATLLGWRKETELDDDSGQKRQKHDATPVWENKSLPNGPMLLLRKTIGGTKQSERKNTKEELKSLPDWNDNVTFQIYGKECRMRRRICQYSWGNISYSYSGLKNMVAPDFPEVVYRIKCQVEDLMLSYLLDDSAKNVGHKHLNIPPEFIDVLKSINESSSGNSDNRNEIFNYCLLNHYRNGEEYMGYHADDEATLHPHYPIASVSLGFTRNFDIRSRKKGDAKRSRLYRILLGDGDLLLMFPPMQQYYEHGIPVEKRVAGDRINLTFRRVENNINK